MRNEEWRGMRRLFENSAYAELKEGLVRISRLALALAWPELTAIEKLVFFKLMNPQQALNFYEGLPFKEKYFLFCGFSLSSIAPLLENLEPQRRRLFWQLPRHFYDRMFRRLVSERNNEQRPILSAGWPAQGQ